MIKKIPITIFIPIAPIEVGHYWFSVVDSHLKNNKSTFSKLEMKQLPDEKRLEIMEELNTKNYPRMAMTLDELKHIAKIPEVTIGAHTVTHPILPKCSASKVEEEIKESQRVLNQWLQQQTTTFAYPNGSYDGREQAYFQKYGFEIAATTENAFCNTNQNPYLIPRFTVMDDGSISENLCHMLGIWDPAIARVSFRRSN